MLLRDPLMTYRGLRNWPPVWSCTDGHNQYPKGELGTLKAAFRSDMQPPNRCFLLISHDGSEYLISYRGVPSWPPTHLGLDRWPRGKPPQR